MQHYTVDALYRNRAGKEIARQYPLWKGEAADAQAALAGAHTALTARLPFPEGTDVIALAIKGKDGSLATAREYAEDFEIAYGASAVGSTGLLGDGIVVDLTEEQRDAAEKAMTDRAIDALPDDLKRRLAEKQRADAVDSFFDDFDGDGTPRRKTATTVGGGSDDADGFRVADRQDSCDKSFADCRRHRNEGRFGGQYDPGYPARSWPCPYTFRDSDCGAGVSSAGGVPSHGQRPAPIHQGPVDGGAVRGHADSGPDIGVAGGQVRQPYHVRPGGVGQASQESWTHQVVNPDPIGAIREAAHELEKYTGCQTSKVRVTRAQYNKLVEECRKSGLAPHNITDVRQIHGLDIEVVDDDPHMPSIQVERPSRYATGGLTQIFDEVKFTQAQLDYLEQYLKHNTRRMRRIILGDWKD